MSDTRFIAFYSYKGGVGRSLALANLAYLLAYEGRKVLILDLDLEAPGQHQTALFREAIVTDRQQVKGFLDLVLSYQEHHDQADKAKDPAETFSWNIQKYMRRSIIFDQRISAKTGNNAESNAIEDNTGIAGGSLWLMPAAGDFGEKYQNNLNQLNWEIFYSKYAGAAFFDALKWLLREQVFDDVLIDSRTGFSDIFYASIFILAETIVCVSSWNRQSIEGIAAAVRILQDPSNQEKYGEKRILLVGSPLPPLLEKEIKAREIKILDEWPEFKQWHLTLPYVPHLALEELILTMESESPKRSTSPYVQKILELYRLLEGQEVVSAVIPPDEVRINPFPAIRVEYWSESQVVNYFVDPGGKIRFALEDFMPTVVFGSRGTGKTMLARWFSFETQVYRLRKSAQQLGPDNISRIGLWFRLDINLLRVFNEDNKELRKIFDLLFGQFLDILILRKALGALDELGGLEAWCDPAKLFSVLTREMGEKHKELDYAAMEEIIEDKLASIRAYINNPDIRNRPYIVQGNILLKLLVEELLDHGCFKPRHYFAIFIDEYENFCSYQQRIVNTRLKQVKESDRVTYKLLARNDGIHTYETMAENQELEETYDLRIYKLDEGLEYKSFFKNISDIVTRHLENSYFFKRRGYTNPEELFDALSLEDEAFSISKRRSNKPLKDWLAKNYQYEDTKKLLLWMDNETNLLRQAVAVVLLNQGKTADDVVNEFKNDSSRARDWYHNYSMGTLYWLCSLYRNTKSYNGFNQIVGIAGNNTRVALDLCYIIIEKWLATEDGHKLPISTKIQDFAIHDQAETYFRQLEVKGQNADQVHRFVERLGRLLEIIHKSPRQSEPEINHFKIIGKLDDESKKFLKCCRAEAVLRWLPGNKTKKLADEHKDAWQLNPRYAPNFNISWRRKKCMDISVSEFKTMYSGSDAKWKTLVSKFEKKYRMLSRGKDALRLQKRLPI